MSLLRSGQATAYNEDMTVNPSTLVAAGLTAQQREQVTESTPVFLHNISSAPIALVIGFSPAANQAPPFFIKLEKDNERELSASELGWTEEKTYLVVLNESPEIGKLSVEVDI